MHSYLHLLLLLAWAAIAYPAICQDEACGGDDVGLLQVGRHAAAAAPAAFPPTLPPNRCAADSAPTVPWMVPSDEAGRFVLVDIDQLEDCMEGIVVPTKRAQQEVSALARYYASFYTFTFLAEDPAANNFTFSPEFDGLDLGVFGAPGGGAPASKSKVDLIGNLEVLVEFFDTLDVVPILLWFEPVNDLFNKLRDEHVDWANDRTTTPMEVLNGHSVVLLDAETALPVGLSFGSEDPAAVTVNGELQARVLDRSGSVVESIDGVAPLEWLVTNIVEPSTFPLPVKSVGARMNKLALQLRTDGFQWPLSKVGTTANLKRGPISVKVLRADGTAHTTSWQWKVTVQQSFGPCEDILCLSMWKTRLLLNPGQFSFDLDQATQVLFSGWASGQAPAAPSPEGTPSMMMDLSLKQPVSADDVQSSSDEPSEGEGNELAVNELAVNESAVPLMAAPFMTGVAPPWFRWLLIPTSRSDTYGFMTFGAREDGTHYGVFKYATFVLSSLAGPSMRPTRGFDVPSQDLGAERTQAMFLRNWKRFIAEAERRGVTELLVDVVGNGGGFTTLAYQFIQFMFPELSFKETCGQLDNPVSKAYEIFEQLDLMPLTEFCNSDGLQADRMKQFQTNATMHSNVLSNMKVLARVFPLFFSAEEVKLINDLVEAEDVVSLYEKFRKLWDKYGGNPFVNPEVTGFNPPDTDQALRNVREQAYRQMGPTNRGRSVRNFTARMLDCPQTLSKSSANPFTDIIFVSDGNCGSSCATATGQAWALAKGRGSLRSIRFATFGGTGGSLKEARQTLNPNSFGGGNVQLKGKDWMFNPILKNLLIGTTVANIAGLDDMVHQLSLVWTEMMTAVPFYVNMQMPQFTEMESLFPSLGPNSPPYEYVFVPTDIYLPDWFHQVSGAVPEAWNWSELWRMYRLTAQAFSK